MANARKIRAMRLKVMLRPGLRQQHALGARLWPRYVVGLANPDGCLGHGWLPRMLTQAPSQA
jgi:hypothetical protein